MKSKKSRRKMRSYKRSQKNRRTKRTRGYFIKKKKTNRTKKKIRTNLRGGATRVEAAAGGAVKGTIEGLMEVLVGSADLAADWERAKLKFVGEKACILVVDRLIALSKSDPDKFLEIKGELLNLEHVNSVHLSAGVKAGILDKFIEYLNSSLSLPRGCTKKDINYGVISQLLILFSSIERGALEGVRAEGRVSAEGGQGEETWSEWVSRGGRKLFGTAPPRFNSREPLLSHTEWRPDDGSQPTLTTAAPNRRN